VVDLANECTSLERAVRAEALSLAKAANVQASLEETDLIIGTRSSGLLMLPWRLVEIDHDSR
jgi:hypothetical protein